MRWQNQALPTLIIIIVIILASYSPVVSAEKTEIDYGINQDACILIEFKDYLYAGTLNLKAGCELFRSPDGNEWTQVVGGDAEIENGFGTFSNFAIWSAAVFDGALYLGTINILHGCDIWRTEDGVHFENIIGWNAQKLPGLGGFFHMFNTYAWYMEVYNDKLYLGTLDVVFGGRLYATEDGDNWDLIIGGFFNGNNGFGFGDRANWGIRTLFQFKGYFYAGSATSILETEQACEIWRTSDGMEWNKANEDGFGDICNKYAWSYAIFNDTLYIGTFNWNKGCQVWSTEDGQNWSLEISDGFGDRANWGIRKMIVYDGAVYASTENLLTGVEIWKTTDGDHWTQINEDGFGDSMNITARQLTIYNGNLYTGLWNAFNGTTIMRYDGSTWTAVKTDL